MGSVYALDFIFSALSPLLVFRLGPAYNSAFISFRDVFCFKKTKTTNLLILLQSRGKSKQKENLRY